MGKKTSRFRRKRNSGGVPLSYTFQQTKEGPYYPLLLRIGQRLIRRRELLDDSYQFFINLLPREDTEALFQTLSKADLRQQEEKKESGQPGRRTYGFSCQWDEIIESPSSLNEAGRSLERALSDMPVLEDLFFQELQSRLERLSGGPPRPETERDLEELPNVAEIREIFQLSREETLILLGMYLFKVNGHLESCLDHPREEVEYADAVSLLFDIPPARTMEYISQETALFKNGLLSLSSRRESLAISPGVTGLLSGTSLEEYLNRFIYQPEGPRFPLESYPVSRADRRMLQQYLTAEAPVSLLFHGTAGTGKTSFAGELCRQAGLEPCFLRFNRRMDSHARLCALQMTAATLAADRQVLIVDEADEILNTRGSGFLSMLMGDNPLSQGRDKGSLNHILDSLDRKVIWITNRIGGMEDSVRRRFAYNIPFSGLSPEQRRRIWNNQLETLGVTCLPEETVNTLAREYRVPSSLIENAAASAAQFAGNDAEAFAAQARQILNTHLKILADGSGREKDAEGPYSLDWVNTDTPAEELAASFDRWADYRDREGERPPVPLTLLFAGPPGTGKSALARHLARQIEAPLMVRRAAELKSAYVGETEKLIRKAFQQAEAQGAVLLIDEADTFLFDRGKAVRTFETAAVNQFLTSLEDYRGILIATTNRKEDLDAASLRRFTAKVAFMPLRQNQVLPLIRSSFPQTEIPPSLEADFRALGTASRSTGGSSDSPSGGLTPGDIAAVRRRHFFAPRPPTAADLLAALQAETAHRRPREAPVGFA